MAWTAGIPPEVSRMVVAILMANASSSVREFDVERDQWLAGADRHCPAARVVPCRAEVGRPRRIGRDLIADRLVLAAAHVREAPAFGTERRVAVKVTGRSKRMAICSPKRRARSTHSSIRVPPSGTNGMTSMAPMRGCAPACCSMSISSSARPTPAVAARTTGSAQPANVTRCGCGSHRASCRARSRRRSGRWPDDLVDDLLRRPSLKFGTHSISPGTCLILAGRGSGRRLNVPPRPGSMPAPCISSPFRSATPTTCRPRARDAAGRRRRRRRGHPALRHAGAPSRHCHEGRQLSRPQRG